MNVWTTDTPVTFLGFEVGENNIDTINLSLTEMNVACCVADGGSRVMEITGAAPLCQGSTSTPM